MTLKQFFLSAESDFDSNFLQRVQLGFSFVCKLSASKSTFHNVWDSGSTFEQRVSFWSKGLGPQTLNQLLETPPNLYRKFYFMSVFESTFCDFHRWIPPHREFLRRFLHPNRSSFSPQKSSQLDDSIIRWNSFSRAHFDKDFHFWFQCVVPLFPLWELDKCKNYLPVELIWRKKLNLVLFHMFLTEFWIFFDKLRHFIWLFFQSHNRFNKTFIQTKVVKLFGNVFYSHLKKMLSQQSGRLLGLFRH